MPRVERVETAIVLGAPFVEAVVGAVILAAGTFIMHEPTAQGLGVGFLIQGTVLSGTVIAGANYTSSEISQQESQPKPLDRQ